MKNKERSGEKDMSFEISGTTLLSIALLLISFFIAVFMIMIPVGNLVFPALSTSLLIGLAVAIIFGVIFLGFMLVVVMRE